jgi:hypothetical protein
MGFYFRQPEGEKVVCSAKIAIPVGFSGREAAGVEEVPLREEEVVAAAAQEGPYE